jgi:ribulose-5-phosphate 4-epimerase/fuculose-1-phosphate aldolase
VIDQGGAEAAREQVSAHLSAGEAEAVALACRILARYGHEDLTLGHASIRGRDGSTIYIKRKGKALHEVLAQDVMTVSLDDEDGYLAPGAHLETVMHTEVYRARPDVGAVIHTHPLYSIALGATKQGLETLSHDGLLFPQGVPVFDGTAGLVTTPADARDVVRALGDSRAVLLRNHGILVVGEDIRWAVLAALTLERAARLQFVSRVFGDPVPIPREVASELSAAKYREEFVEEYWLAWGRECGTPRGAQL